MKKHQTNYNWEPSHKTTNQPSSKVSRSWKPEQKEELSQVAETKARQQINAMWDPGAEKNGKNNGWNLNKV